jgi:two-component system chemotaxis response regulator CheY
MKILIVDDSRTMRTLLGSFAKNAGAEVFDAADGQIALLQIATHQPFDLVLLDWDMPVLNGLETLKILRANSSYDSMKIMMVTAQSGMESVTEAIECGASDYLMKPLNEEMFLEKLQLLELTA